MSISASPQPDVSVLRDVIGWDIVNWSQALGFWDSVLDADWPNCRCLELGAGGTSLSLWLGLKGASVVCSGYEGVSDEVRQAHERHGVAERMTYERIDARSIGRIEEFDIVAFKSMLGGIMLSGPMEIAAGVVREAYEALKPGGALLFVENLRATPVHAWLRSSFGGGRSMFVRMPAKNAWRYFTLDEIRELFAPFERLHLRPVGFSACFGRSERQRTAMGRLDRSVWDRIVPDRWKYIVCGVAFKAGESSVVREARP